MMNENKEMPDAAHDEELDAELLREIQWLADTGDLSALSAHLEETDNHLLLKHLSEIHEERRNLIWRCLPEERRESLRDQIQPDLIESLDRESNLQQQDNIVDQLSVQIREGDLESIHHLMATLGADEIANALSAMPVSRRSMLWEQVPEYLLADVLALLSDSVRQTLLKTLDDEEVVAVAADLDHNDLVEVVTSASDELADAILQSLDLQDRVLIEARLGYPENSAGRLMEEEWIAVRADVSLGVVSRYLKRRGDLPPHTDGLMVVDREGRYLGKLPVSSILLLGDELLVDNVMIENAEWVSVETSSDEIAEIFQRREVSSIAVVDGEHRLVGRITLDEALDLIREKAESPLMHMAGLEEDEDLFAPIAASAMRRMLWLGINLVTAFLAAWVIGLFEATLQKIVALAVLMPIVASMGGIAGSQTLTLAIRGLALGQISSSNTRWLAIKEISIAAINGLIWALVVGCIAFIWFGEPGISIIIGIAMIINQFMAAISGLAVPLVLHRFGIDPALSGSVVLTTVTDVVGFMSFLGLATLLLV